MELGLWGLSVCRMDERLVKARELVITLTLTSFV